MTKTIEKKDLQRKAKEIDKIQQKSKIRILKGTEVDILADGSLGYPDSVLESLDIVIASVHSGFKKDNTARILKAMENPSVTIIGHLSGRLLGGREAYLIDYEAIFHQAAKTQTWLEINSQPIRLDVSWDHIRRAGNRRCNPGL